MTTKQLEQETGCKIMVRGKGSMRDKKKVNIFTCRKDIILTHNDDIYIICLVLKINR